MLRIRGGGVLLATPEVIVAAGRREEELPKPGAARQPNHTPKRLDLN